MTKVTYAILFLFVSCSTDKAQNLHFKNSRNISSIGLHLNDSEHVLNQCFESTKLDCYSNYPYDEARRWLESDEEYENRKNDTFDAYQYCITSKSVSCAKENGEEEIAEIILENQASLKNEMYAIKDFDWFFLSPSKIKKLLNFISSINDVNNSIKDKVRKTLKTSKKLTLTALHGHGVGVSGSAFVGEGRSFTAEAIILNKELNLFCAPGLNYHLDAGVNLGLTKVTALGCDSHHRYKGQFVSVTGGVSSEAFGLPLSVDAAYSFGLDANQFIKNLKSYKSNRQFYLNKVLSEYLVLKNIINKKLITTKLTSLQKAALKMAIVLGVSTSKTQQTSFASFLKGIDIKGLLFDKKLSLGLIAKKAIKHPDFQAILREYHLKNLQILLNELESSLVGCDSVSGAVSLSLSLNPINFGVGITSYSNLFSVNLEKTLTLKNISALALLNPILMDKYTIVKVIELARLMESLPQTVNNKCFSNEYNQTIKNFSLVNKL